MKHVKSKPICFALAGVLAVTATIGLSACGKFEVDPKAKGASTNSNPLKAESENQIRNILATKPGSAEKQPVGQSAAQSGSNADSSSETRRQTRPPRASDDLDQIRRLFQDELNLPSGNKRLEVAARAQVPGQTGPQTDAPVDFSGAPASTENLTESNSSTNSARTDSARTDRPTAATPTSQVHIAQEISDEAKGRLLYSLVEPTMRINFQISLQRNEVLEMKKVLDAKRDLTKAQSEKLLQFKQSYLLSSEDSIDSLLSRVDVIAFTLQIAPLILESQWGRRGDISAQALADRAQRLNTSPGADAVRFRSGRLAVKGKNLANESQLVHLAELGYNPEFERIETKELLRLTQLEVERVMRSPGISTLLDNRIKEVWTKLVQEHSK